MSNSNSEFIELNTPTNLDIISDIKFNNNLNDSKLLISSWDNLILLYDCKSFINYLKNEPPITNPIFDIKINETPLCLQYTEFTNLPIVGLLDGSIKEIEFENLNLGRNMGKEVDIDDFQSGINYLKLGINNTVLASSFNGQLQVIDTKIRKPTTVIKNNRKIIVMETSNNYLILGLTGNIIEIYDLKNLNKPIETREIGLKYQITDIKVFPDQQGFAVSSIDGRVSIETFNDTTNEINSEIQQSYVFKSHRHFDPNTETDLVYPINSITFNKHTSQSSSNRNTLLYTGGSDGYICLWDIKKRKRLKQFPKFINKELETNETLTESIAKLDINLNNNLLAVATSDDNYKRKRRMSETEFSKLPSKIYLKQLKDL
ncbi:BUB3 [Candida pseudojiufengensis]|uniref:BUB3 n=1 Tax=Candida pseudojiufengensis TaxID=497109 RepID=UPI002224F586|nr:BUB3 [Candida pseudojiufengensis]KAI5964316.1 BUB3 [Candida pseudojiufengensis]